MGPRLTGASGQEPRPWSSTFRGAGTSGRQAGPTPAGADRRGDSAWRPAWRPWATAVAGRFELRVGRRPRLALRWTGAGTAAPTRHRARQQSAGEPTAGCPPMKCSRPVGAVEGLRPSCPPNPELGRVWRPSAATEPRTGPSQAVGRRLGEACDRRGAHRRLAYSRNRRLAVPRGVGSLEGANCPAVPSGLMPTPAVATARWERTRASTSERVEKPLLGRQQSLEMGQRRGLARHQTPPRAWGRPALPDRWVVSLPRAAAQPDGVRKSGPRLPSPSPAGP